MAEHIKQRFLSWKTAFGTELPLYIIIGLMASFALWSLLIPFFGNNAEAISFSTPTTVLGSVKTDARMTLLNVNGVYYLGFINGTDADLKMFLTTSTNGTVWSTPVAMTPTIQADIPQVGQTQTNSFVSFAYNSFGGYFGVLYTSSSSPKYPKFSTSSDGATWSSAVVIDTNTTNYPMNLSFATSSNFSAVVYEHQNVDNSYTIYVATSTNGTLWTSSTPWTTSTTDSVGELFIGVAGAQGSEVIHILQSYGSEGLGGDVIYGRSTDFGTTFVTSSVIPGEMHSDGDAPLSGMTGISSFALDSFGNPGFLYVSVSTLVGDPFDTTSSLYFAKRSSGGSWTTSSVAVDAFVGVDQPLKGADLKFFGTSSPLLAYPGAGFYPFFAYSTTTFETQSVASAAMPLGAEVAVAYDTCAQEVGYGYITSGGVLKFATSSVPNPSGPCASPTLTSSQPPNTQQYVPIFARVEATFNTNLDASTVNTTNVTLKANTGNVQGGSPTGANLCESVLLDSNTKIVCEHLSDMTPLATSTWYTMTIGTGLQSSISASLASAVTIVFQTGDADPTGGFNGPPHIMTSFPNRGAQDFPPNANMIVEFPQGDQGNMAVSGAGLVTSTTNVLLKTVGSDGQPTGINMCASDGCALTWTTTTRKLKIDPASNLSASTNYVLVLARTMTNVSGIALNGGQFDEMIFFKTSALADSTAPAFSSMQPASGTINVALNIPSIDVFFSKQMDDATLNYTNVKVFQDTNADRVLDGGEAFPSASTTYQYDSFGKVLHIGLKTVLPQNKQVCVEVGTGAQDVNGTALTTAGIRCFTTVNSVYVPTPPTVEFGDCNNFQCWVNFSQPLDPTSAVAKANYVLENPVGVQADLTNATLTYRPEARAVEFSGLSLQTGQVFKITATGIKPIGGASGDAIVANGTTNVAQGTVMDSTQGGNIGNFDLQDFNNTNFATFWEKPERCVAMNRVTGSATDMKCEFPAPGAMPTGSTIVITLPTGFTMTRVATTTHPDNLDLNQFGLNTPVISAIVTSSVANTITLTTGGGAIASGERVSFELNGIVNSATAGEKTVTAIVKNNSNVKLGSTISFAPFKLGEGGNLTISGTACKGTGSASSCGEEDTGISSATVFCESLGAFGASGINAGRQQATTNGSGEWTISNLSSGEYGCGLVKNVSTFSDMSGGADFKKVFVGDTSKTGVDFRFTNLSVTGKSLTVTITSADSLSGEQLDLFCNAGGSDFQFSAPIFKTITLDGDGAATQVIKLQPGKNYDCGVGPHMDFEAVSKGTVVPDFQFMPPRSQQVYVPTDSNPTAITFALKVAGNQIIGTVKDGSGTGIANVFVHAAPSGCFDSVTGAKQDCFGGFTQTTSSGGFALNVSPGSYEIGADAPGMPPSESVSITVDTSGNVYKNGTLIDGDNPLVLKLAKSSVTIAGSIQDESGNGIKYAHVSAQKGTGTCSSFTPSGGFRDSPTDSSGNYTLYVTNGTWKVEAFSPSYGRVGCTIVTVSSGTSQTGQNIQASSSGFKTISGTALGGSFISAHGASGSNHTVAGSDNTYSLKVPAGTGYTVNCFANGNGPCGFESGVNASSDVTVNLGATVQTGTVVVTITGITDAFVDVRNSSGRGSGTGQNNSGVYSVVVPTGTYTVRAGGPRYGELCSGQTVVVTNGSSPTVTCTAPSNLNTVNGRVTDGTNNVSGATVKFINSIGKSFVATTDGKGGSNNNLSVSNVPNGTYTVSASKAGYVSGSTSATVASATLTLSSPIALTQATGANGASAVVPVQSSGSAYTGKARVIATLSGRVVVVETDKTTGNATVPLTNGAWTVKAICDNGKESSNGTVTISGGSVVGDEPTLACDIAITGFDAVINENQTMSPATGGLITSEDVEGLVLNVPASTLHTSDTNTGKIEIKTDPTIAGVNPGEGMAFIGSTGYNITPTDSSGNTLGKTLYGDNVSITIPYTDADVALADVDEDQLQVASLNADGEWETFPTVVDSVNNLLIAQVSHFSSFGVVGGTTIAVSPSPSPSPGGGGGSVGPIQSGSIVLGSPAITLNSGATSTASRSVVVTLQASGASQVALSNSLDFSGATFVAYASSFSWTLAQGNGTKSVYVRFRSSAGGTIDSVDTIQLTGQSFDQPTQETAEGICLLGVGKAYKSAGSSAVYYITEAHNLDGTVKTDVACAKRAFRSSNKFFTYFATWDSVVTVDTDVLVSIPDDVLGFMPAGPLYNPKYGALVKVVTDPKIYLLLGTERYWITSESVFNALGYAWSWVEDVANGLLDKYTVASEINYTNHHPNYTIVKYPNDSAVYRLEPDPADATKQVKRHIFDESAFKNLGFRNDRIVTLDANETYADGEALTASTSETTTTPSVSVSWPTFTTLLGPDSVGDEVRALQQALRQQGFFTYASNTGYYGTATVNAVKAFQKAHGLSQVGIVGPQTRALLNAL